jgi:hypothetical protein
MGKSWPAKFRVSLPELSLIIVYIKETKKKEEEEEEEAFGLGICLRASAAAHIAFISGAMFFDRSISLKI